MSCRHAPSSWRYRVSTHRPDESIDDGRSHMSQWTCADHLTQVKREVATFGLCAPVVIDGATGQVITV